MSTAKSFGIAKQRQWWCVVSNDVAKRLMAFIATDDVLWDAVHEIQRLQERSDHWKNMYEIVAARLYKIENGWTK